MSSSPSPSPEGVVEGAAAVVAGVPNIAIVVLVGIIVTGVILIVSRLRTNSLRYDQ